MSDEIAGYPLLDDGTPFPGGVAFATKHPQLGTPLILRRYRSDWFAPAESLDGFQGKAKRAIGVKHANLGRIVDAGFVGSEVYAIVDPVDGATLESLVKDLGALPTFMACEFARQAALGLAAAHDAGMVHGDVSPAHLMVGPLTESSKKRADGSAIHRPGPDATSKLTGLGLVPARPSGREWAALDPLARHALGYLPPERVEVGTATGASDIYGLGATLFFLLAGRAPYVANSAADVVNAIANTPPAPLATLRPDLPAGLVDLVMKMLSKNVAERPAGARAAADALKPFADPEPEPVVLTPAPPEQAPVEAVQPGGWAVNEYTGPAEVEHTLAPAVDDHHNAFASAHSEVASQPQEPKKKKNMSEDERAKLRMWLYLGGFFWFILVPVLWLVLLSDSGCFSKPKETQPRREEPKKTKDGRRS